MAITRKTKLNTGASSNPNNKGDLDLISDLPSHVIKQVLNRLPVREVVRTSILSRKWRYYWKTVQHLDLGYYQLYQTLEEAFDIKNYWYRLNCKYTRIINKIFSLHLGPLVKVRLHIPKFDKRANGIRDVEQWIVHLSKKNIRELTLTCEGRFLLPHCIFSCLHLTQLELDNITFEPLPDFKGFPNLIMLQLIEAKFKANMFESLIHGSPLLQKLILEDCRGINHFKVSAPNLESFHLQANRELKTICFENVPKLADVTIDTVDILVNHSMESSPLLEFLMSLPKLTLLSVNGHFLKFLAGNTLPQELPTKVEGLKYLKLDSLDFTDFDEISCALCLIRNTPNLKALEIEVFSVGTTTTDSPPRWGYLEAEATFGCTLDMLRAVKIEFVRGSNPEVELVKFLLANSPFLQNMTIIPVFPNCSPRYRSILAMATELIRCYKASPGVVITLG